MKFSIKFLNGIFEVKISGKANPAVYVALLDTLVAHEHWRSGSRVLSDELELDTTGLETKDILAIADVCGAKRTEIGASKFAAVVQAELVFGLNRMWEVHVGNKWDAEACVFRDREEALEWLSV